MAVMVMATDTAMDTARKNKRKRYAVAYRFFLFPSPALSGNSSFLITAEKDPVSLRRPDLFQFR